MRSQVSVRSVHRKLQEPEQPARYSDFLPPETAPSPYCPVARERRCPGSPAGSDKTYPWHLVVWLTGVDYFSSSAYEAGIV